MSDEEPLQWSSDPAGSFAEPGHAVTRRPQPASEE